MIRDLLPRLVRGETLTREEAAAAIRAIVRGETEPVLVASFLTALAQRGESADELAGGAEALRSEAVPFPAREPLLDTCGTGGDRSGSYNISTAVAFICAGAGVPVAKHGNRSVSSRAGSADVLEALGARVDLGPEASARILDDCGFCFLYARRFHPSVRNVAEVRETLGVRTLFNWLGPLANPARATHQLVGVPDGSRVEMVARVLGALGARRALVVHGAGGLDELALEPGNTALFVESKDDAAGGAAAPKAVSIEAAALGLEAAPVSALQGGGPEMNASIVRGVLAGEKGPRRDVALLNAAAALWVAGRALKVADGVQVAAEAIDSGAAARTLERFLDLSTSAGDD
jgi:anthranilate phosphoribosyltransferase